VTVLTGSGNNAGDGYLLAALAQRLPWAQIEAALAPSFVRRDREGRAIAGADLFGPTLVVAGSGISAAGPPRLSIRLMA